MAVAENDQAQAVPHLDLYNFEEPWAKDAPYILTSPRSLEACSRCAIQPVQLLFKSLPQVEKEWSARELPYTDLYDIYQRSEQERQELLKKTREERERMMWTAVEAEVAPLGTTTEESGSMSSFYSYSSRLSNSAVRPNTTLHSRATRESQALLSSASSASTDDEPETIANGAVTGKAVISTRPKVRFDPAQGSASGSAVTSTASASSSFSAQAKPAPLSERRRMELVGQKVDLHARPKTPQGRSATPQGRSATPQGRSASPTAKRLPAAASPAKAGSTSSPKGSPKGSPKSSPKGSPKVARSRNATASATQLGGTTDRQTGGGKVNLSASGNFSGSKRQSTRTAAGTADRPWSSADGALLARATTATTRSHSAQDVATPDGAGSSLWSPEELSAAVVGVGMSAMDARKMRLLSDRDRRILQKMVERRRAEAARKSKGQTAELQWKQQAEHRRSEKQLEEQELRKTIDKKREKERAVVELRRAALDHQHQDEVDALQQELEEKDEKWSQLYDVQQQRLHQTVQENALKEDRKRQIQELRRAEILVEEMEQKRAMLNEKEAKIETAAETRDRLEREELQRVRARNEAERAAISGRLKEIEAEEAQELLALQSEVQEKHARAERRLEHIQTEQTQLTRAKAEKRDRQAERNREAALQLDHESEQLRMVMDEQRRHKEQNATETVHKRVEERRARTAEDLHVRQAAHARKMEHIRQTEVDDERVQRRQLAEKELRMEAIAREREEGVRESRDRAREGEVLREKLREFCMSDTFDKKAQNAQLSAPIFNGSGGRARTSSANQSSTKTLLG